MVLWSIKLFPRCAASRSNVYHARRGTTDCHSASAINQLGTFNHFQRLTGLKFCPCNLISEIFIE